MGDRIGGGKKRAARVARGLILLAGIGARLAADITPLVVFDPLIVTPTRSSEPSSKIPFATDVLSAERIRSSPAGTVDDVLRELPAFSLFRRSSSLYANPTAQGVSLRGIGPSGASRSLVLLDGIPLNDPFGGWVAWSKIPRDVLSGAEVVRGGGSTAWGNAALGGVIQLFTRREFAAAPTGTVTASAGNFATRNVEFHSRQPAGEGEIGVAGAIFETDGFFALAPSDRGAVDRPLSSRHKVAHASWRRSVARELEVSITGRWFVEERGNGTPLQQNQSREWLASVGLRRTSASGANWSADAYFQRQNFESFFSAVKASRDGENPANFQYDVPADAAGAAWAVTWGGDDASTSAGADVRWVKGRSADRYFFSAGDFTRERVAGGEQLFAGVFVNHRRTLFEQLDVSGGVRFDRWENRSGFRREFERVSGAVLRNDAFADADGGEVSPNFGISWSPLKEWRLRAAAYRAFRVPTLNEFYRPFRVGIISTEANHRLAREILNGAEVGAEFARGEFRARVTAFVNDLRDTVANVTLSRAPSAISRQRQNLDRTQVKGLELGNEWRPVPSLRLSADWLWNDTTIKAAFAEPSLAGRTLPQVPSHTLVVGLDWEPTKSLILTARVRHVTEQFEDDENAFPLPRATRVDLQVRWTPVVRWEIFAAAENLVDAQVATGRSNDGVVSLGAPRQWRAGLRYAW